MAHQDVTNTVQIEIRFSMGGNNAQNTLHALCTTAPGLNDLEDLAAVVDAWVVTEWAPLASSSWGAYEIVMTSLDSLSGPRASFPIAPPQQGTLAIEPEPANVTLAVKADTGIRGRGKNGRVFWIGLNKDQVTGNQIEALVSASIVTALNNLNNDIAALANFDGLCVPHRVVNGVEPNPATSALVQRFLVTDLSLDSQKNRLPFHKKKRNGSAGPTLP